MVDKPYKHLSENFKENFLERLITRKCQKNHKGDIKQIWKMMK